MIRSSIAPSAPTLPSTASAPKRNMTPRLPSSKGPQPPEASERIATQFSFSTGVIQKAERIGIYGPGGVGKSELASLLAEVGIRPLFLDIENGSTNLDVARIDPAPSSLNDVRDILHSIDLIKQFGAIVIDTVTMLEQMVIAWTLENIKTEKGVSPRSIDGYGWGKGYTYVYESFLPILGDLDRIVSNGVHVILVMHDCVAKVPNPTGEDFIRYEPRLQVNDKGNIRARVKEWLDHLLFIGFDVFAADGKASGSGTRTIYTTETPTCWAKSRRLSEVIPYDKGSASVWQQLFNT